MSEPKIYKGIASEEQLTAEIDRLNRELEEASTIANNNYEVILKCNRQINDLKRELARYRNGVEVEGYVVGVPSDIDANLYFASGWSRELGKLRGKVRVLVMKEEG